ncbi:MAG: glycerate kinase [Eubacteriales bacterium]|nr:glycerate kinase [Eubacteriales bacterium]
MEYSKFSLGLRFAMTSDAGLAPEDCWNIAFSEVPLAYTVDANLFGAWDDVGTAESETSYICLFSNLPLQIGKALYQQLQQKPRLLSYLTIYRPFIQNNLVEKCSSVQFLGNVKSDGSVSGGDVSYGNMHISGDLPVVCNRPDFCNRILIAPDAWEGKFTSADAVRHMLRSAAHILPKAKLSTQLIADGGQGTMDAMVCSMNGRYQKATISGGNGESHTIRYGILPDRTVVFESEGLTQYELEQVLTLPQNRGFTHYYIAAGSGPLPEQLPQGVEATVMGKRIPASRRNSAQIEYRNGIETVLETCNFHQRLSKADWLIVLTRLLDDGGALQDPTADALLFHCRILRKHTAVLAFTDDGRYFAKIDNSPLVPIETTLFDDAADALFLIIRNSPIHASLTGPVLPDTVINDI